MECLDDSRATWWSEPTAVIRRCVKKPALQTVDLGAPMDVLWMRLSRRIRRMAPQTLGRIDTGRIFVMLNREEYWQCAYVIRKGSFDEITQQWVPGISR